MADASASMEISVDIVGNGEAEGITLPKTANPVVYQLVRVDDDGRLVPATDDEVIAVEDLLEDDQSKSEAPDTRRSTECSTSYGRGLCASDKDKFIGSEGQLQHGVLEDDVEKPKMTPITVVSSEKTSVQDKEMITLLIPNTGDDSVSQSGIDDSKTSNSPLGIGLKPDFSLLNGEINLDKLAVKDLQETFKATFGRETSVKDKQWLKRRIIMGLTNACDFSTTTFVVVDDIVVKKSKEEACGIADCSVLVDCAVTSCEDDKQNETHAIDDEMRVQGSSFQGNCESMDADTEPRPAKRVRKPTKRYIEEFSEGESRDSSAKTVSLFKDPENDKPSARHVEDFGLDSRCLTRKDSIGGSGIQVPYVSRIRRSRPRENFMTLMPIGFGISSRLEKNGDSSSEQIDNESQNRVLKNSVSSRCNQEPASAVACSERLKPPYTEKKSIEVSREVKPKTKETYKTSSSDDEVFTVATANGGLRRKHHRPWTLTEVVKLVEGVAKYGAGRWSDIKRFAFASYSYRTSVDLKDKWRNLLRASLADSPSGNGMHSSRKQTSVPIPAPILSRVRELADVQTPVPPSPVLPGFSN